MYAAEHGHRPDGCAVVVIEERGEGARFGYVAVPLGYDIFGSFNLAPGQ